MICKVTDCSGLVRKHLQPQRGFTLKFCSRNWEKQQLLFRIADAPSIKRGSLRIQFFAITFMSSRGLKMGPFEASPLRDEASQDKKRSAEYMSFNIVALLLNTCYTWTILTA
jgi:hypothetical protein